MATVKFWFREQCRPLVSRRARAAEETEELIIIDNDVLEPGAVTTQPLGYHDPEVDMLKPVRRLTQKHIASSPYKVHLYHTYIMSCLHVRIRFSNFRAPLGPCQ